MPELILDREKCLRNIETMASKAGRKGLEFRPHCKTHQSTVIASWFRDFGVSKITVSSFQMASYFAKAGWEDILVAFPYDPAQMNTLNELMEKARISILLDSPEQLPFLEQAEGRIPFYVDIDTGYGRTGVKTGDTQLLEQLIRESSRNQNLAFSGFYCHAGHSYHSSDPAARNAIHTKACGDLALLKEQFQTYGPRTLYGDTPNCSTQEDFTGIDELTPGNFVFYDLTQSALGACSPEDIAVAVRCPVVSKYSKQNRLLIHGGAVHFSKEFLDLNGSQVFGKLVESDAQGWSEAPFDQYIHSISQEHGILKNCGPWMKEVSVGDTLSFLPVHSCLTANLMRSYTTTRGQVIPTLNSTRLADL